MDPKRLKKLLNNVKNGTTAVEEALEELSKLPFSDLGMAMVDNHRALRTGFPEVILGQAKTAAQIARIVEEIAKGGHNVLVTRVSRDKAAAVVKETPGMIYHQVARALVLEQTPVERTGVGPITIVTAGTSDIPVAEEAALVAEFAGNDVRRVFDVGVAGIHRLLHQLDDLREASVIVVVAGMEGALASVIGGLVACPVVAVPTSIGYGASFNGVAALLGMLNSCAAGVTVVNIDNGFGAGYAAAVINRVGSS
jgi:NCAIR mutase (PurE)-related protein